MRQIPRSSSGGLSCLGFRISCVNGRTVCAGAETAATRVAPGEAVGKAAFGSTGRPLDVSGGRDGRGVPLGGRADDATGGNGARAARAPGVSALLEELSDDASALG